MPPIPSFDRSSYQPEHVQPRNKRLVNLKSKIDAHNLTDMWDMILTVDYQVSDASQLHYEAREEFLDVIELLLQAFNR